jgi:hypothetical protein
MTECINVVYSRCMFRHSAPPHPLPGLLRPSLDSLDSRHLRGCAFSRDNQTRGCRSTCSAECQAASYRRTMMTPPIENHHAGRDEQIDSGTGLAGRRFYRPELRRRVLRGRSLQEAGSRTETLPFPNLRIHRVIDRCGKGIHLHKGHRAAVYREPSQFSAPVKCPDDNAALFLLSSRTVTGTQPVVDRYEIPIHSDCALHASGVWKRPNCGSDVVVGHPRQKRATTKTAGQSQGCKQSHLTRCSYKLQTTHTSVWCCRAEMHV